MAKAGLLFVGTDDGLVLFSNPNNIGRWLRIGQPFRGHAVRAVWPLADNPLVVLAAVAGLGVQRSDDGGQSWGQALDVEAVAMAGDRASTPQIYLSTGAGMVYRSDDAGTSWIDCAAGGWRDVQDARLAVAHEGGPAIYLGLGDGAVWVSRDGGASWAPFASGLPAPIAALVESYALPGSLYVVAGGALYRCDGESPCQPLTIPGPAAGALATLAGKNPALLFAQPAGGIARSDDGGATWAPAGAEGDWGGAVTTIAPASYHIDTAFAGSAGGRLLGSSDRGRTWQLVKQELPPIRSIAAARLA